VPWCQILVDEPDRDEERSFKLLMRNVPNRGDLIDLNGEQVLVTSVSLIPPRSKAANSVSVLVYCRQE
jgi:hypothetical protein